MAEKPVSTKFDGPFSPEENEQMRSYVSRSLRVSLV